jgi:hypothetical protein
MVMCPRCGGVMTAEMGHTSPEKPGEERLTWLWYRCSCGTLTDALPLPKAA